jgi:hypothetical protein
MYLSDKAKEYAETSHLKLVGNDSRLGEGGSDTVVRDCSKYFGIDTLRALQSQFGD